MTGKFMTDARFEEVTELAACYLDRDPEVSQALTDCQEEIIWLGSRLAAAEGERDRALLDAEALRRQALIRQHQRDALREQNARLVEALLRWLNWWDDPEAIHADYLAADTRALLATAEAEEGRDGA